jgi:NitT/TauT family transport system substrate-binding protein
MEEVPMRRRGIALFAALAVVLAACSSGGGSATSAPSAGSEAPSAAAPSESASASAAAELKPIRLQLQWFPQAQFAGYFAAKDQGFYKDEGLDVTILPGAVEIVPATVVAGGQAEFGISWVPRMLAPRESGADPVVIGQVFQRSPTLQVSFKDKNITTPEQLKGKKVGSWGFGNESELYAGLVKAGLDPANPDDVTIVQQQFDMVAFVAGEIDAAQAMIYNEYAQVLEAKNPKTGELYTPDDFNRIDWNTEGTAMLQDAIWANTDKLQNDKAYQDQTVKFLEASFKGWMFCRDNAQKCRGIVVARGSKLGASHQLWQMNEINKLVWPSPNGIGMVDKAAWDQTVKIAQQTKNQDGDTVLTKAPEGLAYTNDYAQKALDALKSSGDADVNGTDFKPITVKLNAGGA